MPNGTTRFVLAFCASLMALPLLGWSGHDAQPGQDDAALLELIEQAEDTMRRFGQAEAPAKEAGTFRLTTYNIENLFDDVDDPTLSGDNEDIDDTKLTTNSSPLPAPSGRWMPMCSACRKSSPGPRWIGLSRTTSPIWATST